MAHVELVINKALTSISSTTSGSTSVPCFIRSRKTTQITHGNIFL